MSNELKFFFEVTQRLSSSLQLDRSLKSCFDYLEQQLPIDGMYINLFRQESEEIQMVAHADRQGGQLLDRRIALTPQMCDALNNGERPPILILNYIDMDSVTHHVMSQLLPKVKSLILLKMHCDDFHLGVVGFYSYKEQSFRARHADMLQSLHQPFAMVTAFNLQGRNLLAEKAQLEAENRTLRRSMGSRDDVIGANSGLKQVMEQVEAIAPLDSTVLIQGETGCGKEVIANAIHTRSARAHKPFIKVNCGAIPDTLIDSELFGYEKGAFTGAEKRKQGYFEQANGGTIFLDELGELPLSAQVRLLRVLQSRTIVRVGGVEPVELDIRIVAATHRDLQEMMKEGTFREDLWYRLSVFPIAIPPLRHRRQDVPLLVHHLLEQFLGRFNLDRLPSIAPEQLAKLQNYNWPGNVRELVNAVERAMIQSRGAPLQFDFLGPVEVAESLPMTSNQTIVIDPSRATDQLVSLDMMTAKYIEHALRVTGGKIHGQGGAAEKLDIHPNTLRSRMKKLGIL
ncbi:sigma-54 interaction domain-containing protein [Ferrimonas aestuarii]|uniref:Sigma-54-dependent Fis family transcriptional regulator n=1 Tax=Ferrimonas aestuarii TaxID=2569539 RepID=A0A4U1BPZ4_9GAMM|nr:sigma-54 dependent transcriptional regulator [Ferrimonas aestuarii]TKB56693.1 sigma-54-dependent Fis family transcriptional regulator [Ferrimonas aestuarii]